MAWKISITPEESRRIRDHAASLGLECPVCHKREWGLLDVGEIVLRTRIPGTTPTVTAAAEELATAMGWGFPAMTMAAQVAILICDGCHYVALFAAKPILEGTKSETRRE